MLVEFHSTILEKEKQKLANAPDPVQLAQQENVVQNAQTALQYALDARDSVIVEIRSAVNANPNAWTRSMAVDGALFVPFVVQHQTAEQNVNEESVLSNLSYVDIDKLVKMLEKLVPRMVGVTKRIESWNGQDIDDVRVGVIRVIETATQVIRDARLLATESQTYMDMLRNVNSFTNDDKRELFYTPASTASGGGIRPLRDYLQPTSPWATV